MKKMQNKTIIYIIVAIVISLTIGFASLSNTLLLEDILAIFRIDNELRVTNFFVTNVNNGGSSLETEYNHDRVVASIYLPNSDSTVTYKVVVTNLGNKIAQIKDITNLPSNIDYELNDYNLVLKFVIIMINVEME